MVVDYLFFLALTWDFALGRFIDEICLKFTHMSMSVDSPTPM